MSERSTRTLFERPSFRLELLALLVVLLGSALAHAEAPTVVLLSWDGVRHDQPASTDLPALERMAREQEFPLRLTMEPEEEEDT